MPARQSSHLVAGDLPGPGDVVQECGHLLAGGGVRLRRECGAEQDGQGIDAPVLRGQVDASSDPVGVHGRVTHTVEERSGRRCDVRSPGVPERGRGQQETGGVGRVQDPDHLSGTRVLPRRLGDDVLTALLGHQRSGELGDRQLPRERVHALDRLEGVGERLVQQRVGRERQVEVLVVGVHPHPPRVRLALQEPAGGRVVPDPPGQRHGGVGGVAQQQRVVAGRATGPVDVRVELEELGVAEQVDRVVDHRRVTTGAVRRGDQLGDEPSVQVHRRDRTPVRVVDLERDHEPRDAHRRVDDAALVGGVRVHRVDHQTDTGRAGRHVVACLRLADRRVVEGHRVLVERAGATSPGGEQVGGHRAALDPQRGAGQGARVVHREERQRDDGAPSPGPGRVHQVLGGALGTSVVRHDDDRAGRARVTAQTRRLALGEHLERDLPGAVGSGHVVLPVGRTVGSGVEVVGLTRVGERRDSRVRRTGVRRVETAEARRAVAVARARRVRAPALVDPDRVLRVDVQRVTTVLEAGRRAGPEAGPGHRHRLVHQAARPAHGHGRAVTGTRCTDGGPAVSGPERRAGHGGVRHEREQRHQQTAQPRGAGRLLVASVVVLIGWSCVLPRLGFLQGCGGGPNP